MTNAATSSATTTIEASAIEATTQPIGTEDARLRVYEDGEIDPALVTIRGKRWSDEEIARVTEMFRAGESMEEIVKVIGRSVPAIVGVLARTGVVVQDHPYAQRFADMSAQRDENRAKQKAEKEAEKSEAEMQEAGAQEVAEAA